MRRVMGKGAVLRSSSADDRGPASAQETTPENGGGSGSTARPGPLAVLLAALLFLAGGASAQTADSPPGFGDVNYWTVGYTVNAPSQLLGFSTSVIPVRFGGWGVYADLKLTADSPGDRSSFQPGLTATQVDAEIGDGRRAVRSGWTTVNLAVVRPLTPDFVLYAGAGYSAETAYQQYFDPDRERTPSGLYWVEDRDRSGTRINLLGGALLRFGEWLAFQLGGESSPTGFSAGAALAIPRIW